MSKITLGLILVIVLVLQLITGISSKIEGRYAGMPERCLQPMDFGHCRAKMMRYYFNTHRNQCSPFYYGGCAGNTNNFKTMEECNEECGAQDLTGNEE